jgi:hypothetical protein
MLLPLLISLAACGGGDDDDGVTPTAVPAATAVSTTGVPSDEIRSVDLERASVVETYASEIGGTYVQANVLYADVTGDGVEDAVIPLSSGGTLGNVALLVVTPDGSGVLEVLRVDAREFGVTASVDDGALVTVEPVPGPDDPLCCPSQIRTTTYAGDGSVGLVEESSIVAPNTAGSETPATGED